MSDLVVVLTTCPTRANARRLAKALLDERLAACVQVSQPIESYYIWEDETQSDQEYQVVIKTRQTLIEAVFKKLLSIHPYDVPQFVVLDNVSASQSYLEWMRKSL